MIVYVPVLRDKYGKIFEKSHKKGKIPFYETINNYGSNKMDTSLTCPNIFQTCPDLCLHVPGQILRFMSTVSQVVNESVTRWPTGPQPEALARS